MLPSISRASPSRGLAWIIWRSTRTAPARSPLARRSHADSIGFRCARSSPAQVKAAANPILMEASLSELLLARDARTFGHVDQPVNRHTLQLFDLSQRPTDLEIDRIHRSQPEVQAAVAHRQVGRLAQHFLRLYLPAIMHGYPRADRAAIRFHPGQLHLDPVVAAGDVITQQGRRLVLVVDEDVNIAIVVEIAKCKAAAGVGGLDSRTGLSDQFLEPGVTQVAEDHARSFERHRGELLLHLRINVTRHPEDVGVAVVVQVRDAGAPTDEAGLHGEARAHGHVAEAAPAVV